MESCLVFFLSFHVSFSSALSSLTVRKTPHEHHVMALEEISLLCFSVENWEDSGGSVSIFSQHLFSFFFFWLFLNLPVRKRALIADSYRFRYNTDIREDANIQ